MTAFEADKCEYMCDVRQTRTPSLEGSKNKRHPLAIPVIESPPEKHLYKRGD